MEDNNRINRIKEITCSYYNNLLAYINIPSCLEVDDVFAAETLSGYMARANQEYLSHLPQLPMLEISDRGIRHIGGKIDIRYYNGFALTEQYKSIEEKVKRFFDNEEVKEARRELRSIKTGNLNTLRRKREALVTKRFAQEKEKILEQREALLGCEHGNIDGSGLVISVTSYAGDILEEDDIARKKFEGRHGNMSVKTDLRDMAGEDRRLGRPVKNNVALGDEVSALTSVHEKLLKRKLENLRTSSRNRLRNVQVELMSTDEGMEDC